MSYSQPDDATIGRITPRKRPSQRRATQTVETILEGAAHILEELGLEGYTTNRIASRAGVSIGSLYQYFPNKDAVTLALIRREDANLVGDLKTALSHPAWDRALREMVVAAARYQLRRPLLATLLDSEDRRLSITMETSGAAEAVHASVVELITRASCFRVRAPDLAASDIMAITAALSNAAARRADPDRLLLASCIEGAIIGYLEGHSKAAA